MKADFETIMAQEEVNFDDIKHLLDQRFEKYKGKSFIEKYALYMGMTQILELQLKQVLHHQFGYISEDDIKKLEKKTFGQSVRILKSKGVRPDIIVLLESNRDNRNNMAHSFLVDTMISTSLGFNMESIEVRQLDKSIYELEQLALFWEWCVKHDALMPVDS
ncbi:TPA: hypothetical protein PKR15_004136 [Acinetobacter baumannii]|nr:MULTISPECIES: hypothetical protein [Acinetobacter]MCW3177826.1 hypothetical protein [Acinetobacter baumannii]MCZ3356574.1 hypothetical protein [Acinetobacter baumannii]MDN8223103.1 hypothetical protein [Acinetobacter baumannii]MDV4268977.1 hypothetical protein [Acinetobacter baumannii]NAR71362.1 hypothetical protein [Acinetobacter haemolyticus]